MLGLSIFDEEPPLDNPPLGLGGPPYYLPDPPIRQYPIDPRPRNNPALGLGVTDPPEISPIDGGPVKDPNGVCNCLWAGPTGECDCHTVFDTEPVRKPPRFVGPPIKVDPTGRNPQTGGVLVLPGSSDIRPDLIQGKPVATNKPAADNKILGLDPLVALGIAAAGIFLIASMTGSETKSTKGGTVIL